MQDVIYDFELNYYYAKEYFKAHGNCLIPKSYKVLLNGKYVKVGKWCVYIRKLHEEGRLSLDQINLLKEINFVFKAEEFLDNYVSEKWMRKYNFAKKYHDEHGNLLIPIDYVVVDEHKNVIKLGAWLEKCRKDYLEGELNKVQISLLNGIDMRWETVHYEDDAKSDMKNVKI